MQEMRNKCCKKPTKKKVTRPGQTFYYEYFPSVPGCKTMYLLEEAKRDITIRITICLHDILRYGKRE